MQSTTLLLLTREDLPEYISNILFEDIDISNFASYHKEIESHSVTMFVDEKMNTKIIANRFGNKGAVS